MECACCGGRFRRFLAYPSLFCPRCGSYERHRALCLWLDRNPGFSSPPLRLLHVAPERALEPVLRRSGVDYVSIDIEYALAMHRMDVTKMTFEDGSFDRVVAVHVLQDVPDLEAALREIHRVLRPDGCAILQLPMEFDDGFDETARAAGFLVDRQFVAADAARNGLEPRESFLLARPASDARA